MVEDDADVRGLFATVLRSRGHEVVGADDVGPAWRAFSERAFPLILLDLGLPAGGGLDLCRRMRAHDHGAAAVIVVITGQTDPAVFQSALDAGADDYVVKPVDVATLRVRLAIAERAARRKRGDLAGGAGPSLQDPALRSLLANLDEVIFSVDPRTHALLRVSPASLHVLGRSPDELLRDPGLFRGLLYPEALRARAPELGPPGRSFVHRWQVRRADGALRWLEVVIKGVPDADGGLARVEGVLTDVTAAQRFEEELGARNKELMTLYRISEVTLGAASAEHAYDELLDEVCRATGFPIAAVERYDADRDRMIMIAARGTLLERGAEISAQETLSGLAARTGQAVVETDARTRPEMANALVREVGVRTWLALPMVIGSQVVGTLSLAHVDSFEPDRRLVRWAGSLANGVALFLDRIDADDALRESVERHRTVAEQLHQANQELERFAYSVSHDLRAPLRTMQGFAHALIQNFGDRLPAEARDYAQRIIASGQQSEVLIRDLLAYSRLSFEDLQLQPVDLEQIVRAARDQLEADIREAGAEVTVEGPLPTVLGQSTTLIQVVTNLISNSIKFAQLDRRPVIGIRAGERDGMVRLRVEDNGIGIPPGQEERIFRVFERLTESGARPGTGIGLAIVRRGMERMGGRAGVERRADVGGSAFWLDLRPVEPRKSAGKRRRNER